jgi:hypothetical protein
MKLIRDLSRRLATARALCHAEHWLLFVTRVAILVSYTQVQRQGFGFLNIIISERDENTNKSVHKMNLKEEILN